ncbi:MAG: hypothetical protein JO352_16330 [Chloroflexi bacterium]|nr:hypothetical protein [Chloroflexota bacterium]
MTTLPAHTCVPAALVPKTLPWCGVVLALAILSGVADAAMVNVVAASGERWRGSEAAPGANTNQALSNSSLIRGSSAVPVVVRLAYPNGDGSTGTLTCYTSADHLAADTLVFATEVEAREVGARLCARAREG